MSRDLYDSDSDESVDNDTNAVFEDDEVNNEAQNQETPEETQETPEETKEKELELPEEDTSEDSPEDAPEDSPEDSDSDASDEAPPFEVNEIVQNDERFDDLYKETNLNAFVALLKDSTLLAEPVQVMLACKYKFVEIDVTRDLFGWSKQIKYPSEQFKTFVPGIPVQIVNLLSTKDVQRVNDKELIYDGLKERDPMDSISFLQLKKGDNTITPPGEVNSMTFPAFTPMVDLVLQNPGYLTVLNKDLKLSRAFNFLNASIVKTSDKKQKMIRGKKELVKTFNLRDIVYILQAAGAKSVVFYNVCDTFTAEDNVLGELEEDDEIKGPDEVSLDFDEPKVYPAELDDVTRETDESRDAEPKEASEEEISNVSKDSEVNLENSSADAAPSDASPVDAVPAEAAPADAADENVIPDVVPDEIVSPEPVEEVVPDEVVTPEPAPGNSVFDDKRGGKYTRALVKKKRANTHKLRLVHKGHR